MWVAFLDNESQANAVKDKLRALGAEYKQLTPSFGGIVLESQNPSRFAHFAVLPSMRNQFKAIFDWVHLNLNPKLVISSGLLISATGSVNDSTVAVPSFCLRSAGRVDMGNSILYEEIAFDKNSQDLIRQALNPSSIEDRLFSSEKFNSNPETHEWIFSHLGTRAIDHLSGEILLMGKRFSAKIACVKISAAKESTGVQALAQTWLDISKQITDL